MNKFKGDDHQKFKISIYTIDFSLEVDLNGILKYLSIYFIFSEYTCQIGKEIVDYKKI